ncbi:uncharacterized protein J4E78_010883 [Alternaria triticimaculans]|uniref:uncharacterized protein n=1 Tax=Alternaria triticimaculans TaxID=297637 RepID=UPI0020C41EE6|nr:uncharacterized protein J4E78_010883 [Alternaria triticimaculans]KAI4639556.1 hypothetical protein J4E78_010883 [Alternaria triticimaculans]
MSPPAAASSSFSHAVSLAHYETKNSFELMVMAKLRCVSDAGENQEIIARLMAQDRENGTWPGKHEEAATKTAGAAEKMNGEQRVVVPVKGVLGKKERTDGTGVGGAGRPDHVPVAIVSGDRRARTATAGTTATSTRSRSPIIPLSQLAQEWDQDWGAPFAFPLAATTSSKSQAKPQAKPTTPSESVSSGSKSPATPTSPTSPVSQASRVSLATPASSPPPIPASLKSNPYNLLMSDEQDDEEKEDDEEEEEEESENEGLIIPLKMYTGKARAAAESTRAEVTYAATFSKDTATAPTERPKNLPAPDSLASSEPSAEVMSVPGGGVVPESPVVVRDFGAMVSSSRSHSAEEAAHKSDIAAFYNMPPLSPVQPAVSRKNTGVQIFASAPPSPPSSPPLPQHTHTVPSSPAPTKSAPQRRNEQRKQDQVIASSNRYDALVGDDIADPDDTASASVDTDDDDEHESDVETSAVPKPKTKKNRRRGKKGGKKVQAMKQKVEQAVEAPVVVQQTQTVANSKPKPMKMKMKMEMERSQALGVVAIVMVLVALLGARVLG